MPSSTNERTLAFRRAVPMMPVEIMLLPRWFPFHLDKISYWSRTVIVPLLVLLYVWLLRRRKKSALRYASLALVREAMGKSIGWRRHLPPSHPRTARLTPKRERGSATIPRGMLSSWRGTFRPSGIIRKEKSSGSPQVRTRGC